MKRFALVWLCITLNTVECWLEPCEPREVNLEGCTCINQERPQINCNMLVLSSVPSQYGNVSSTIRSLELSNNRIVTVNANSFTSLSSLRQLILNHNRISSIEAGAFQNVKETLIRLDLGHNRLSFVPTALDVLHNLKFLDLSYNSIHQIQNADFAGLSSLAHLFMDNNMLRSLSNVPFGHASQTISYVTISLDPMVNDLATLGLPNLESLEIIGQKISLKSWGPLIGTLPNLKYLSITHCSLTDDALWDDIPSSTLQKLEILILSNNLITLKESNSNFKSIFQRLQNITRMDLNFNKIQKVSKYRNDYFRYVTNLQSLSLEGNEINVFEPEAIEPLIDLRSLSLKDNQLKNIRALDLVQNRSDDFHLLLEGNPWDCRCRLEQLSEMVKDQVEGEGAHLLTVEVFHTLLCDSPNSARGTLIKDYTIDYNSERCREMKCRFILFLVVPMDEQIENLIRYNRCVRGKNDPKTY